LILPLLPEQWDENEVWDYDHELRKATEKQQKQQEISLRRHQEIATKDRGICERNIFVLKIEEGGDNLSGTSFRSWIERELIKLTSCPTQEISLFADMVLYTFCRQDKVSGREKPVHHLSLPQYRTHIEARINSIKTSQPQAKDSFLAFLNKIEQTRVDEVLQKLLSSSPNFSEEAVVLKVILAAQYTLYWGHNDKNNHREKFQKLATVILETCPKYSLHSGNGEMKDMHSHQQLSELGCYLGLMAMYDSPVYSYHDVIRVWKTAVAVERKLQQMDTDSTIVRDLSHVKVMLLFIMRKGIPQRMPQGTMLYTGSMAV
jgi:hypothetical protein